MITSVLNQLHSQHKGETEFLPSHFCKRVDKTFVLPPFQNTVDFLKSQRFPKHEKYPQNKEKMETI